MDIFKWNIAHNKCKLILLLLFDRNIRSFSPTDELAILAGPGYETVKANMELLDTLMQEVQDFNDVWTEKLDEIMKKHDVEYNRFSQQQARP